MPAHQYYTKESILNIKITFQFKYPYNSAGRTNVGEHGKGVWRDDLGTLKVIMKKGENIVTQHLFT